MVDLKDQLRNPNYANSSSFARAYMTEAADRIAALEAQLTERVKVPADELTRYINRCREMSENGKYSWWSRLAEILSALEATPPAPKVTECATEGCAQAATVRFERGGVGSDYCHDCYMRIQALTAAQEAGRHE